DRRAGERLVLLAASRVDVVAGEAIGAAFARRCGVSRTEKNMLVDGRNRLDRGVRDVDLEIAEQVVARKEGGRVRKPRTLRPAADRPPGRWHWPQIEATCFGSRVVFERSTRRGSLVWARSTLPWQATQSSERAENACVFASTAVVWQPAQRSPKTVASQRGAS